MFAASDSILTTATVCLILFGHLKTFDQLKIHKNFIEYGHTFSRIDSKYFLSGSVARFDIFLAPFYEHTIFN